MPPFVLQVGASPTDQVISKGLRLPLEVFKTEAKGWGVRCREKIPRGTFICEYVGEVLTNSEAVSLRVDAASLRSRTPPEGFLRCSGAPRELGLHVQSGSLQPRALELSGGP